MKTKQNLKALLVPTCQRCSGCGRLKIAVAWESLQLAPRSAQPWRFYCEECSRKKGIEPSPELMKKLPKMETGRE
jgi:hypothetical protein